jgi:hypothetical protein
VLVGHYAPALALKRAAPSVPLWVLFVAAQAVDFLFAALVFAGIESAEVRPGQHPRFAVTQGVITHSLAMSAIWAVAVAAAGRATGHARAGVVLGVAVLSHWLTDLLVHAPDLPLAFDPTQTVGLALWRWPWVGFALDVGLVLAAAVWWGRTLDPAARRRLSGLVGALVVVQVLADFVIPFPPTQYQMMASATAVNAGLAILAWRLRL